MESRCFCFWFLTLSFHCLSIFILFCSYYDMKTSKCILSTDSIPVFILGLVGIACSSIVCLSPHYFSFVSTRNDTFYCIEKNFPKPFEFATEANVGLFRYEILEVFEYPWPPWGQRELFDAMHNRELQRLIAAATGKTSNSKDE